MPFTRTTPPGRVLVAGVTALLLAALGLTTTTPAQAAPGPTDVITTFDATPGTLGAIPDATAAGCGTAGVVRTVEIPVTGVTRAVTDIRLSLGLTHTWAADVSVTLVAPDGTTSTPVISRTGATSPTSCGDSSNLDGTYVFYDGAPANLTAAATDPAVGNTMVVPTGDYQPTGPLNAESALTAPFAGLADHNGTWTLAITDSGNADTGSVTAASLIIAQVAAPPVTPPAPPPAPSTPTPACAAATTSVVTGQAAVTTATKAVATAKKAVKKAKKSGPAAKIAKSTKKLKAAKKKLRAARAALAAAQAAQTTACR